MKKETKELLDWIKKQISISGTVVADISQPNWQKDKKKAFDFLDTLPKIESRLCKGGYIQDKYGRPCCDGDRIKINSDKGETYGILSWNKNTYHFNIALFGNTNTYSLDLFDSFEKVE